VNESSALVSLADVAEMASVTRPAVSNWRRRSPDFPKPVEETGATSLFLLEDIRAWMIRHGKRLEVRTVDQLVWSALNPERAAVLPEEAAQAGMVLLGYVALARHAGPEIMPAVRAAIADDDQPALEVLLARLGERARQLGLGDALATDQVFTRSPRLRAFLASLLDLASRHGAAEVFDALIAAVGRGSRGEGDHTTPPGVAELVMSLAPQVTGVVLDPACGYGTLLLAASLTAGARLTLAGQDVDPDACRIARLRMLAHDLAADIRWADTLATPSSAFAPADLVVAEPSVGTGREMAWLRDGISRLRPGGTAMFVLGSSAAYRGGADGDIRRRLLEARAVRAVVALPSALYPTAPVPVSLWVVTKPGQDPGATTGDGTVLLADASSLGKRRGKNRTELTGPDVAAITTCYREWEAGHQVTAVAGVRAVAVPVRDLLAAGGDLSPARWTAEQADPAQLLLRIQAAEYDLRAARAAFSGQEISVPALAADSGPPPPGHRATRKVTELAEIFRTRRVDPHWIGAGDTPFIRPQDVGPGLTITPGGRVRSGRGQDRADVTQAGDIVVAAGGTFLRAAVDPAGGAIVSAPLQILRPLPGAIAPVILAALITGARGDADLAGLEVPVPDPGRAERFGATLADLDAQRRQAAAALDALDQLRSGLVEALGAPAIRLAAPAHGDQP